MNIFLQKILYTKHILYMIFNNKRFWIIREWEKVGYKFSGNKRMKGSGFSQNEKVSYGFSYYIMVGYRFSQNEPSGIL